MGSTSLPPPAATAVAVEAMCSAMGVPSAEAVVRSGLAMEMVRRWGGQFRGAYGTAQPGAGVCEIGAEVRERCVCVCVGGFRVLRGEVYVAQCMRVDEIWDQEER